MPNPPRSFESPFTGVPGALEEIRAGRMVVVVDDEDSLINNIAFNALRYVLGLELDRGGSRSILRL